jgi:TPR repeat protein
MRFPRRYAFAASSAVLIILLAGCAQNTGTNAVTPTTDVPTLQRLTDNGNPVAANNLGAHYAGGTGVPQDFEKARKWYLFASEHGNPAGELNLAVMYQNGQGTPVNRPEALKWYHLAVDHNYAPAKFALGVLYQNGNNVPRDETEAARLMLSAAIQGFVPAQGLMAVYYLNGTGVEGNDGLAYEWASIATSRSTPPISNLTKALRDSAAKGLDANELSAAQAITAAWKPGSDLASPFAANSGPRAPRLRGGGSGFIVGVNGEIATDYHVVPNCSIIHVRDASGTHDVVSRRIAGNRAADLAILSSVGFGSRLTIRNTPANQGETVTTYGYPLGNLLGNAGNLTTGTVSGTTGYQGDKKAFQMTAPIQPGSSGGPVVDEAGLVIGIAATKLNALAVAGAFGDISQNVNFAWYAEPLKAIMDENGIAYNHVKPPAHSPVNLPEELRNATVKVECWR